MPPIGHDDFSACTDKIQILAETVLQFSDADLGTRCSYSHGSIVATFARSSTPEPAIGAATFSRPERRCENERHTVAARSPSTPRCRRPEAIRAPGVSVLAHPSAVAVVVLLELAGPGGVETCAMASLEPKPPELHRLIEALQCAAARARGRTVAEPRGRRRGIR